MVTTHAPPAGFEPATYRLTAERSANWAIEELPQVGIEPTTPRLEVWCAIQLRHWGFYSHTGTRTRVGWVKTSYPNHLDYMGL